jgi:hypothetical protein
MITGLGNYSFHNDMQTQKNAWLCFAGIEQDNDDGTYGLPCGCESVRCCYHFFAAMSVTTSSSDLISFTLLLTVAT